MIAESLAALFPLSGLRYFLSDVDVPLIGFASLIDRYSYCGCMSATSARSCSATENSGVLLTGAGIGRASYCGELLAVNTCDVLKTRSSLHEFYVVDGVAKSCMVASDA